MNLRHVSLLTAMLGVLIGCNCNVPLKIKPIQSNDKTLTCKDIILEINEAEHYLKTGAQSKVIELGEALMPSCWVAGYIDGRDAVNSAEGRIRYLSEIYDLLECGGPEDGGAGVPTAPGVAAVPGGPALAPVPQAPAAVVPRVAPGQPLAGIPPQQNIPGVIRQRNPNFPLQQRLGRPTPNAGSSSGFAPQSQLNPNVSQPPFGQAALPRNPGLPPNPGGVQQYGVPPDAVFIKPGEVPHTTNDPNLHIHIVADGRKFMHSHFHSGSHFHTPDGGIQAMPRGGMPQPMDNMGKAPMTPYKQNYTPAATPKHGSHYPPPSPNGIQHAGHYSSYQTQSSRPYQATIQPASFAPQQSYSPQQAQQPQPYPYNYNQQQPYQQAAPAKQAASNGSRIPANWRNVKDVRSKVVDRRAEAIRKRSSEIAKKSSSSKEKK